MSMLLCSTGQPKGQRDITPGAPFEPAYVYKMLQTIAVNPHFKVFLH